MLCENCGYNNPDNLRFCRNCEIDLQPEVVSTAQPAELIYAGLRTRLLALLLDVLLFVAGTILLLFAVGGLVLITGKDAILHDARAASLLYWFIACTASAYFILMESGDGKASLGKRWLNLAVEDSNGEPLSLMRAAVRLLASFFSVLLFPVLLVLAFTQRKQALHDLLAGSVVVQANDSKKISVMATLLVLFIALMVPVLALLATAGKPYFQQYIQQVQLEKGLKTGHAATLAVARFYHLNGRVPVAIEEVASTIKSPHLSAIDINQQNGEITLTFKPSTRKDIRNKHLLFAPAMAADKSIRWRCYSTDIEARFLPASCQ